MTRKPLHDVPFVPLESRRALLRQAGILFGAGALGATLRDDLAALLLGKGEALAQSTSRPTYFIEICLREQWDLLHVLVPPGLAKDGALARSGNGSDDKAAAYWQELHEDPARRLFLTEDSSCLFPHTANIALLEINEATSGTGGPHNHAAVNPIRSPGYGNSSNLGGEIGGPDLSGGLYGRVPTPASFHNLVQKKLSPNLENGVCLKLMTHYMSFKGIVRHYGGGVPGAELSRFYNLEDLRKDVTAFNTRVGAQAPQGGGGPSNTDAVAQEAAKARREMTLLSDALKRLDKRALERAGFSDADIARHQDVFESLRVRNQPVGLTQQPGMQAGAQRQTIDLNVSDAERAQWSSFLSKSGVRTPLPAYNHFQGTPFAQPWEQFLIGYKLLAGGYTRSFACELDWADYHGNRPADYMRHQARIIASGLANLVESLKAAGLFQDSLIAIYTSDGGRSPRANTDGGNPVGRNTVLLAGGAVNGGYFGDIRQVRGDGSPHYAYSMPDLVTGLPVSSSITDKGEGMREGRIPGAVIWRTVAAAMGAASSEAEAFSSVASSKPLPFVVKT